MDERTIQIRDLLQEVVLGFGVMHAKTYAALISGEIKTARQLSGETGISHNKIYSVLKDLAREKIIYHTKTSPASYHAKEPSRTYEKLVDRKILALEKKPEKFDKIIHDTEQVNEREYLVRFTEKQTSLTTRTRLL